MTDNNARDLKDLDLETILKEIYDGSKELLEPVELSTDPQSAPDAGLPTPEPVPMSDLESLSTSDPEPVPMSDPEPVSTADPEAFSMFGTESFSAFDLESAPTSDPEPVSTADPESFSMFDPESFSAFDLESVPMSDPEPVSTADPESLSTFDPETFSAFDLESVPMSDPEPVSTSTPEPEPASQSIPALDSQNLSEESPQIPSWEEPSIDYSLVPEELVPLTLEDDNQPSTPSLPTQEALPTSDSTLEGDTIRFSPITDEQILQALSSIKEQSANEESAPDAPPSAPTPPGPAFEVEEEFIPSPSFFTPHSQLKKLKKKLVSGPERLYYNLSENGTVKLQLAIILSVLIVAICSVVTTLYALDMIPENRLKLVIITQILAMLFSALLGSQLMIDSFIELFRGKFTVNMMLTITFFVCLFDAFFCLQELRIPCCAAFSLEMTMGLFAQLHQRNSKLSALDTMRKAVRLHGLTRVKDYYSGKDALLRTVGEVEDFMDHYDEMTAPQVAQSVYALVSLAICTGIAVYAGRNHGLSMAIQILSTSLLVAVPASFFVSISRPTAILAQRLHMVGTVFCGWQGIKGLCRKAAFPIYDQDLFPNGSIKFNGVKFYGEEDPADVVSYSASLINAAGGSLVGIFKEMISERDCMLYNVQNFQRYSGGGIGGEIHGVPVLLGSLNFLQDMGVDIPEGTTVNQAVYTALDGQLSAVYAITYAKNRFAAAGLISLCSSRKTIPIMLTTDFLLTESFLRSKLNVKTKRIVFPEQDAAAAMRKILPAPDAPCFALATRTDLISFSYAVSGARALRTATRLGVIIHIVGGILGMLIMLALAVLGNTELLTPTNVLLYQLIWAVPGLLITEWTRIL